MNPINLTVTPRWETKEPPPGSRTGINDPSRVYPSQLLYLGDFLIASYFPRTLECYPPRIIYTVRTPESSEWDDCDQYCFDFEHEAIAFCLEEMSKIIKLLEAKKDG